MTLDPLFCAIPQLVRNIEIFPVPSEAMGLDCCFTSGYRVAIPNLRWKRPPQRKPNAPLRGTVHTEQDDHPCAFPQIVETSVRKYPDGSASTVVSALKIMVERVVRSY